MKQFYRKLFLLFCAMSIAQIASAQNFENFEDETINATSFTSAGQVFNITAQAGGSFFIQHVSTYGWNGTSVDDKYIDNYGTNPASNPVQFTISASGGNTFALKSMYLLLAKDLNFSSATSLAVNGSTCTITGKRNGVVQFTTSRNSGFNTDYVNNNGFTLIDLANYGGSNNSNEIIDEFIITTSGQISYVALDAFRWASVSCPLTASITSQTNVACNGANTGSITVAASGGTPNFNYVWTKNSSAYSSTINSSSTSNTISGLSAGSYSVTITDGNGCIETASATITEPSALSVSSAKSDVSCFGGSDGAAAVSVSGGTGAGTYTYSWVPSGGTSNIITGRPAGTYTVTITDANSCIATRTFNITQPASAVSGTTVVTNVSCNGGSNGSINLTATGGTGPYTFNWGGGITTEDRTGLTAGTYSVTVTDANGCTGTVSATVTQPAHLNVSAVADSFVTCYGNADGGATANPSGGTAPYTYLWSSAGTTGAANMSVGGLAAGTYSVTVTDANGCTATDNVTIMQPALLTIATTVTNVSCNGGTNGSVTINPAGGTGPYEAFELTNGSITRTSTARAGSHTFTGLPAGTYTLSVADNNGCTATGSVTITEPAAPVSGTTVVTNVACNGGSNGSINLTATGGTGPYAFNWGGGVTAEDRTGLAAGTYSVTVTDANGCTGTVIATVTQPATSVSGTTVVTNVSCNGGSNGTINLTPTGGTGPYTFDWGGGITTEDRTGLTAGTYSVTITDANSCTGIVSATITQPAAITASISAQTNVSCNGGSNGSATVTATGGTSGYTYSWNTTPVQTTATATGLAAGSYTVTVTDAKGCIKTANATITQPTAITASATVQTNVSCNGGVNGSATAVATGGTAPYTYLWSNGATTATVTGLPAGVYSVHVTDANNCTKMSAATVTITEPTAIAASISASTNVSCNSGSNGSATVTATGGAGSYTYSWNTTPAQTGATATGLAAGTYTVTVTDANGCTKTATATITQPTAITASISSQTNVACNGSSTGSATVSVSGGTGSYTYNWSPGNPNGDGSNSITGLTAGAWTVTVTDANGCSATATATITEPAIITATITSQTNVSCNGGSNGSATAAASGGAGGYTYLWSNGSTTQTVTGLPAGVYSVHVTDANNCTKMSAATVTITESTTITASVSSQTNVSCNGGSNGSATVTATGGTGAYTYSWNTTPVQTTATATGLSAGTYIVTVTDANGCIKTATATITEPTVLAAAISAQTNVACNGGSNGSATVTATGGTGAYTYSWNTAPVQTTATATGLSAGTYMVTVTDANGCSKTATATITEPTLLVATTTQTNVSCNGGTGGTIDLTVSGGTAPYTYNWGGGITTEDRTGLSAGTYTVTVTDANGCAKIATATITEPTLLVASISAQTNVACNNGSNGSATVTATGGTSGYTYSWNTTPVQTTATVTGLAAGSYIVTVTDANGCTKTASATITQPTVLATTGTQANVSCNGGSNGSATVTATGGIGAYTYSWNTTPVQSTATASNLVAGTYTVTVTDANNCSATRNFTITEPAALATTATQTNVSCNGAADGTATVSVTGGTGSYTYSWNTTPAQTTATATGLTAGTYMVTVTDANNCSTTRNFTITQPAALALSGSQVNVSCNGGSDAMATVSAIGGTAPYTYSWNTTPAQTTDTITGLSAGTYIVTVTDANNCSDIRTVTITEPAVLSVSTSTINVSCNGGSNGSATVTATGGTTGYSYSWNTSPVQTTATASSLVAGVYVVTVTDANGCTTTDTATITEPTPLVLTTAQVNVSIRGAADGVASVAAMGGATPYTYSWNTSPVQTTDTITGLVAGTYVVTVTDANNCSAIDSVIITEPGIPTITSFTPMSGVEGTSVTVRGTNLSAISAIDFNGTSAFASVSGNTDTTVTVTVPIAATTGVISLTNPGGTVSSVQVFTVLHAPTAIQLSATAVDENVAANTVVGSFTTTDIDTGSTFIYTLVTGTGDADNADFTINGADLQINVSPDFEIKSSYAIRVRSTDQSGLFTDSAFVITINDLDEIAPAVVISSSAASPTNVSPIPVTVTFSEAVVGFTAADITMNNGTITNFGGSGSVYTFDLVASGNGTYMVNVAAAMAQDSAGNDNLLSNIFSIDYIVTSVAEVIENKFEVVIYPNPTKSVFTIEVGGLQKKEVEILVINSLGQVVSKQTVMQQAGVAKTTAGAEGLASGVYLVQITDGKTMIVKKVVVQP